MKRTATTLALLAGFSGGCMSTDGPNSRKPAPTGGYGTVTRPMTVPGMQGPAGEPVPLVNTAAARGAMPGSSATPSSVGVQLAAASKPVGMDSNVIRAHLPGVSSTESKVVQVNGPGAFGPPGPPAGGIYPVPGMGPPGAVAAVGAINPQMRPPLSNQRTSINFTGPAGMKITWQLPGGGFNDESSGLTAPKDYNFLQGQVYRLRLSQILPNYPGRVFYPTLEVTPVTPKTMTFLAHSSVPVTFEDEDFRQAASGNLVVKVVYLPDPQFQDFAVVAGPDVIVSTRLEPGADPVAEAQRRGSILAIIRLGNIDLENRASPAMTAPPPGMPVPMVAPGAAPPLAVPPGAIPAPVAPTPVVPNPPAAPKPGVVVPPPAGPTTSAPPIATPTLPPASKSAALPSPALPGPLPPTLKGTDTNAKPSTLPSFK